MTPNEIFGLLIQNGKPKDKIRKIKKHQVEDENNHLEKPLTVEVTEVVIKNVKNKKAAALDGIYAERLK